MLKEYNSFRNRLGRWLEGFGFIDDPFALYEADQERSSLPFFFVDRPYLHTMLGNPAHPQTAILMAGRGDGKTATREMVAYECAHAQLRRRALAVRYYDFSLLLEQVDGDVTRISARHHIRVIARFILKAIVEDVPPTYFDLLEEMERALLMGYAAEFADPISGLKLSKILPNEHPVQLNWEALSPRETLAPLAELVTRLGQSPQARYQALYILVDRVDETAAGPKAAISLLKPLVSEGPLLEMGHVAFKFFLPIEVGEQLRQTVTLRPDRISIQTISWNQKALEQMVQQRLYHYSEGRVVRLEELCTPGAKTDAIGRLIRACEGSPRTLLRLCQALIHHHVVHSDKALIERTDILDTLADFGQRLEVERTQPPIALPDNTTPTAPTELPQSGLYLGEGGHVWIDGKQLTPPLSDQEFKLLHTLYWQAPQIVPNEALIETVWPSSAWTSDENTKVMDEQNLRKLITRLRTRLPGTPTRFVKNVRGRGYWLKINGNSEA